MIKVFMLKNAHFLNGAFTKKYLYSKDIVYTKIPFFADVIVSESEKFGRYKIARKLFFFKKFIIWTNEPRVNCQFTRFKQRNKTIMNVYSGNVFLHNLHFLGSYHNLFSGNYGIDISSPPGVPLTIKNLKDKKKFCLAVFQYRNPEDTKLFRNGQNIDLNAARQNLALFLYKQNKADIVGSNWPKEVKVLESSGNESGNKNWTGRKIQLLSEYKFNICFANTAFPNYCTEKIWHAIAGGCLPIYYGKGTSIYNTFPQASFIDASQYESHDELLNFLESISDEEYINRYNKCLKVMHSSCVQRLNNPALKTDILDEYVHSILELVKGKTKKRIS